ncbi:tetratricopeptide repeat protein [Oligoflexus tunisiensis]|uniref:tetratricopeptide repeat protein n=1 Tax=Oligoflexus tunisiensis TaxID=708132 RepID=UPI00114D2135|nr:tetratricopeptide repeat protein [Oligoflexus tunisiensis]
MAGERKARLAITARESEEVNRIRFVAHSLGFSSTDAFNNTRDTYQVASRSQYDIFITYQSFQDMTGLTMIQSLRETGNYGLESHLVLVDVLNRELMVSLAECNIKFVVQKPFSSDHISQKLESLWREERNLNPTEKSYREAHAAFQSGMNEMALDLTLKLVKEQKANEKILLLLGDIFLRMGRQEEAHKVYQKARTSFPQSYVPAHKIAKLLMKQKRFTEAVELLDDLARLSPLNLEILANTGLANFELGRYEAAKAAMTRLRTLDRKRKDANEVLARIAIREGDYNTSFKALMESHGAAELCDVLHREAEVLRTQKAYLRVVDFYLKHIEMLGDHPMAFDLYYRLGLAYQDIYDSGNALRYLQKAVDLEPSYEPAGIALTEAKANNRSHA